MFWKAWMPDLAAEITSEMDRDDATGILDELEAGRRDAVLEK